MAITYNAGTNTITVIGYTEGTPCTFIDIYNADVAGGWGVVYRLGINQYYLDANLTIGDSSTVTYIKSENEHIKIQDNFRWTQNGNFRAGNIDGNGDTFDGSIIEVAASGWADTFGNFDMVSGNVSALFYNSKIITPAGIIFGKSIGSTFKAIDCLIYCQGFALYGTSTEFNRVTIVMVSGSVKGFGVRATYITPITDVVIQKSTRGFFFYSTYSGTIKNSILKNITYDFKIQQCSCNNYVVNTICGWIFNWVGSATARVYRQYTTNLKVVDKDGNAINGATVKIWDKDSNLIVDTTTNASGVITTQTITRGYYNQANGNTLQEASPHLITIEKIGYTTYEADFTLEDTIDWTIALQTSIMRNPSMGGGMS